MRDSYDEKLKPALRAGGLHGAIDGAGYGIGQFFVYCMYSLAFWYGGQLVTSGKATPNDILQVFLPIFMAAFGAGQAQMYFPDVARGRAAATRVFSIVDRVPVIDNLDDGGEAPLGCEGHLEFDQVRFAYPSRPNLMVFRAFSLDIPPRTSMALVGESGSGKSTVVGLIQRFYAPLSGVVTLDGHDIATLNMRWLRSQVGLVGQEPVLFSMSVRDNITYGVGKVEDEHVHAAAQAAFAADFIDALPNGYHTLLGSGGVSLSGGQKQRLAIARALVKDPKVRLK
jgi:ATP-binding cassette subfamily B (MDR/TAP) protein 1